MTPLKMESSPQGVIFVCFYLCPTVSGELMSWTCAEGTDVYWIAEMLWNYSKLYFREGVCRVEIKTLGDD